MKPVCEVDQWGLWVEAECRSDEFRGEGVDEVDQAGAAEPAWRDAAAVEHVAEVGSRSRYWSVLGLLGNDDVRLVVCCPAR